MTPQLDIRTMTVDEYITFTIERSRIGDIQTQAALKLQRSLPPVDESDDPDDYPEEEEE